MKGTVQNASPAHFRFCRADRPCCNALCICRRYISGFRPEMIAVCRLRFPRRRTHILLSSLLLFPVQIGKHLFDFIDCPADSQKIPFNLRPALELLCAAVGDVFCVIPRPTCHFHAISFPARSNAILIAASRAAEPLPCTVCVPFPRSSTIKLAFAPVFHWYMAMFVPTSQK